MTAGRVEVDGQVVTTLGSQVVPGEQEVRVDGELVELQPERWIAVHKPPGYLTARRDDRGRRTVYTLLPPECRELFHVGRLDRDSEGLLILTNAGGVAHRMLHPSYEIQRRYRVQVSGQVGREEIARLQAGLELEDGYARAENVELEGSEPGRPTISLTLREGRKREVRRMMEALGLAVRRLMRVGFGPIDLGGLEPGDWRELTPDEIGALRRAVDMRPSNGDT